MIILKMPMPLYMDRFALHFRFVRKCI
jgi:hypothetical protein